MTKTLIIANWKMNPGTAQEARKLFGEVAKGVAGIEGVEVVLCPPFVYIPAFQHFNNPTIALGAQNCFWENPPTGGGAFTGEISPRMLKALGCEYVILGHSERAKYLGETERMVQKKVASALKAGLKAVLCVGEREQTPRDAKNLIVAYEPEWAISSEGGQAADVKLVAKKVSHMRRRLKETPILYGGSVDSSNISLFLEEAGVQGALVGSASLRPKEFIQLVKNAAA